MKKIFENIWKLALPYQDKRNDEGHAKTVLYFVHRLVKLENADKNIVIPAAILHDIGWSQMQKEESLKIFGSKTIEEERIRIQRKHEKIGAIMAKEILEKVNYNPKLIDEILEIISQHDTRKGFISKNEGIMRDADKLWRFSKKGFSADIKRRNNTPKEKYEKLKTKMDFPYFFYSDNAKKIAKEELKERNRELNKEKRKNGEIRSSQELKRVQVQFPPAVRKAQASLEFLALVMVVMLFSVAIYAGIFGKLKDAFASGNAFETDNICRNIAEGAWLAKTYWNGFSMNATVPQGNFSASVSGGAVVCSSGKDVSIQSLPSNVTNSTGGVSFSLRSGKIKMENVFDVIVIS